MVRRVVLQTGAVLLAILVCLVALSLTGCQAYEWRRVEKSASHIPQDFPAFNLYSAWEKSYLADPTPTPGASNSESVISSQATPSPAIKFDQISVDQGLSSNSVLSIMQDSLGFLWFGTSYGLDRFDGYNYKTYLFDPNDPYSLSHNIIYSLYEDHQGNIWVGTYGGGLNRFDRDRERFHRYKHDPDDPSSLSNDIIFTIYEDRAGNLWIGTMGGGMDRYDRDTDTFIHYFPDVQNPYSQPGKHVYTITEDRSSALWIGTDNGLARYDRQAGQFIRYQHDPSDPNSISSNSVFYVLEDQQGAIWAATTGGGLNRLDPSNGQITHYRNDPTDPQSLSHDDVFFLLEDHTGLLWIGTMGGGLNQFDPQSQSFIRHQHKPGNPDSLSNDYINCLLEDREGMLWIGTATKLNKYDRDKEKFAHIYPDPNSDDSLSGNQAFSIYEDRRGDLWIGTENGLNYYNPETGKFVLYNHNPQNPHSLSDDWVIDILEDRQATLWIATSGGGIDRFDRQNQRFIHHLQAPDDPMGWSQNQVNEILEDSFGDIWFGTQGGLGQFDSQNGSFRYYYVFADQADLLTKNDITALLEDSKGIFWIGTWGQGLFQFDRQQEKFIPVPLEQRNSNPLPNTYIDSVYEDTSGRLWIGTHGGGLAQYEPAVDRFTIYNMQDGLPDDRISAILEDERGHLWLATQKGISRFDPDDRSFKNFDLNDGLQGNEFYDSACRRTNGEIWFGGTNGITAFYPDEIQDNTNQPPIVLTSFQLDGEEIRTNTAVESLSGITLKWPDNSFEFEFAALSYTHAEKNRYAYMLEGFDRDWNFIGTRRNGRYTNLPGGEYSLKLIGANSDGIWNETGAEISIHVQPPFWESWLFRGLAAILLISGVIGGYRLRVASIEKRSLELEILVDERTQALEQRTHEIEERSQELTALYQADEKLYSHLRLDDVLQSLADIAVDILKADKSSVWVKAENCDQVVMRAERGFGPQVVEKLASLPLNRGVIGEVLATGKPVVVEDSLTTYLRASEPSDILEAADKEGVRSFIHIPIKVEDEFFGIFNVTYTKPHVYGEEQQRLFLALAQRAGMAIQNTQLYEQSQERAVLDERNRLARDLHDSAKQKAFAALAQLGAAGSLLDKNLTSARTHIDEAESLVYDVLQELMILIQELHPVALKERGLVNLLREHTFDWANQNDIEIELDIHGDRKLPLEVEQALYRVAQEALANVSRHSQARHVTLHLDFLDNAVKLVIKDDGRGFDPTQEHAGLGLRSMRERADMVAGELKIESTPGSGTQITFTIP
jgi:ligand-binding sensor domain-containing protein/signal transduction histidine kinase